MLSFLKLELDTGIKSLSRSTDVKCNQGSVIRVKCISYYLLTSPSKQLKQHLESAKQSYKASQH